VQVVDAATIQAAALATATATLEEDSAADESPATPKTRRTRGHRRGHATPASTPKTEPTPKVEAPAAPPRPGRTKPGAARAKTAQEILDELGEEQLRRESNR